MFYLKIRSNQYRNAYLLAVSEPPTPPGRNEASLESRWNASKKERKGEKKKKKTFTKH